MLEGGVEDGVFRKEAGEGIDSGDGDDAGGHGEKGYRKFFAQATHLAHVLLVSHAVNDGACGEEEQRLEEGVRHEMEDGCRVSRDAAAQEHVAELRDGGVGEDALDVGLHQGHGGGKESSGRADDGDCAQRKRRVIEKHMGAGDHVHAGGDHGGGVDQGGDGRGTFHGVGQPDVERQLSRFSGCAEEQAERRRGEDAAGPAGIGGEFVGDLREGQGAEVG